MAVENFVDDGERDRHISSLPFRPPPSPPDTIKEDAGSETTDFDVGETTLLNNYKSYALPPPSRPTQSILPEDLKTPDNHVPRDPRLIRLTGVHPFNVEPPLTELWKEGFLTTKDLHYVRNHGAVPQVHDEDALDWSFTVEGLVKNPLTLTLRDLLRDFEQVTYPVTLVCAGNRRKEQNVVRKTKGFSWGAAGLSTALWTGVPLDILLERAKPLTSRRGRDARGQTARYVCFEGADKLPNGYYGTSIKLNWAMDPNRGIMVAHGMNGETLAPDHGKPLRIIIPGQIGGRSVKWLKRIVVTESPSENWYHIYDNRVLPTTISPEMSADVPDMWRDERYAIYELNVNSAVARPGHGEMVSLSQGHFSSSVVDEGIVGDDSNTQTYRFQGYAYAGGGRRVTRVEVTLDRGRTWRLAEVNYPEDEYRLAPEGEMLFGGRLDMAWRETCFCWCFWSIEISLVELLPGGGGGGGSKTTTDVMVRAMDESMMVQPRDMYWSVLGMMNNPWYRVVVHHDEAENTLRFEHPTQPTLTSQGWMERVKKEGGDLSNGFWGERMPGEEAGQTATSDQQPEKKEEIVMIDKNVQKEIGLEEVKRHDGETEPEPWFVVHGEVYDGTKFLEGHPGGAASIVGAAGQDVTEEFMAIHSENAKAMMPDYHIGTLDAVSQKLLASGEGIAEQNAVENTTPKPIFLHPKQWRRALLSTKTPLSPDTKLFTFSLDHAAQEIGLPTGQHLMLRLRDPVTRDVIIRAYTPYSTPRTLGNLEILIKIYSGGVMTSALDSLPLGHWVEFKGPVGKFEYMGGGVAKIGGTKRKVKRFVMVCGGSGITPIFAVLRAVMQEYDDDDGTQCLVLDGNRNEEDILCRREMDELVANDVKKRCRVVHTLSRPGPEWTGRKGRMDKVFFEQEVGPPKKARGEAGDEMVLVCGPEPLERSVREVFGEMGWKEEDLLFF